MSNSYRPLNLPSSEWHKGGKRYTGPGSQFSPSLNARQLASQFNMPAGILGDFVFNPKTYEGPGADYLYTLTPLELGAQALAIATIIVGGAGGIAFTSATKSTLLVEGTASFTSSLVTVTTPASLSISGATAALGTSALAANAAVSSPYAPPAMGRVYKPKQEEGPYDKDERTGTITTTTPEGTQSGQLGGIEQVHTDAQGRAHTLVHENGAIYTWQGDLGYTPVTPQNALAFADANPLVKFVFEKAIGFSSMRNFLTTSTRKGAHTDVRKMQRMLEQNPQVKSFFDLQVSEGLRKLSGVNKWEEPEYEPRTQAETTENSQANGDDWQVDENGNATLSSQGSGSQITINGTPLSEYDFSDNPELAAQILTYYYDQNFSENKYHLAYESVSIVDWNTNPSNNDIYVRHEGSSFNDDHETPFLEPELAQALPGKYNSDGKNRITFHTSNGRLNSFYNNKYNIVSSMAHERVHLIQGSSSSNPVNELESYYVQTQHFSWKDAGGDFREKMIYNINKELIKLKGQTFSERYTAEEKANAKYWFNHYSQIFNSILSK